MSTDAAAEQAALDALQRRPYGLRAPTYDDVSSLLDARTLEIVERRRRKTRLRRRGWLIRRALLVADLVGLMGAFVVAQLLFGPGPGDNVQPLAETLLFLATLPAWIVGAKLYGLYERDEERTDHSTVDDLSRVFHMVTVGAWLFFALGHLTAVAGPRLPKLFFFWGLAVALIVLTRALARGLCRRQVAYLQNTVIVGAGDVGQMIARKLLQHPEYGLNLVGFIDGQPKEQRPDLAHLTLLGDVDELPTLVPLLDVERVVIAFSNESHERTLELIRSLKDLDVQIDLVPRLFEIVSGGVGIHSVEGIPLVGLPPLRLSRSSRLLKRGMDFAFAGVGLVALAPLFGLIALMIKLDSPGPVFFRQVRMGCRGEIFRVFKFRTMDADADQRKHEVAHLNAHARNGGDPRMFKIAGDPRVTRAGRVLRRYMLDELPQLINVVKGEMSLVGPRPLILEEHEHVATWARRRLDLKPGMTGLWQVLGRNEIPFEEMIRLDYLYVTTWSPWNDARLLGKTIPLVFRGAGGSY